MTPAEETRRHVLYGLPAAPVPLAAAAAAASDIDGLASSLSISRTLHEFDQAPKDDGGGVGC